MVRKRSRKLKVQSADNTTKVKKKRGKKMKKSANVNAEPTSVGHAAASSSVSGIPGGNVQVGERYRGSLEGVQGFIFMCNANTKFDCYRYRVFGLPSRQFEVVKKIGRGAMLFLFDTDVKLLYGVYEASSGGDLRLEPGAFDGRFPAQVKFHIYKDCLPLHERDFKNVIRENYNGYKFKPELSSTQVNNLISLFRPIPSGLPASAGASLREVAVPQSLQTRVLEENSPLPTRRSHPRDLYLTGSVYSPALPRPDHQLDQLAPHSLHAHNQMQTHGVYLQPSTGLRHRTSCYYPADAHQPYLPEEPSLSSQDPYGRYGVTPQMIQQTRAAGYQIGGHTSLLPRGREINVQSGYVAGHGSQLLASVAASHIPLQANSRVRHHTALPPANVQRELPTSYQAYYGVPTNEAASSVYAANPTQQQRTSNYQLT